MRELFIYYRIRLHAETAAQAVVTEFQARLQRRHPGLSARLLWREEPADVPVRTWMETYATADPMLQPAGISPELESEIADCARVLSPWIDGQRHVEVFTSCAS